MFFKHLLIYISLLLPSFSYAIIGTPKAEIDFMISQINASQVYCDNVNNDPGMTGPNGYCTCTFFGYPSGIVGMSGIYTQATQNVSCYYSDGTSISGNGGDVSLPPSVIDALLNVKNDDNTNPNPKTNCGSIIQTSNQVVGEFIPLVGSSFSLSYFSDRVIGRKTNYTITYPVTDENIPEDAISYNLTIKKDDGTLISSNNFNTDPNQSYVYQWDGLEDVGGSWGSINRVFKLTETSASLTIPMEFNKAIGSLRAIKLGLGGWVPTVWHFYDSKAQKLYYGTGTVRSVNGGTTEAKIASEDGKEVYFFDSVGRLTTTKTGLTGATLYSFAYDSQGRLESITEPFGKVTTFSRYANGKLKAIIAPHNIKTTVVINSDGYLSTATNPKNETYNMTYYPGGLLQSFSKPNGQTSTMAYDTSGNLISDTHSSGTRNSFLSKSNDIVTLTSGMGRVSTTTFDGINNKETTTSSAGLIENFVNADRSSSYSSPFENKLSNYVDDPRFGSQARTLSSVQSFDFGSKTTNYSKSALLDDPANPFSIANITESELTGNSEVSSVYNGLDRTKTTTTKLGKTSKVTIDEYERPIATQIGNLIEKIYSYTDDKLTLVKQGTRKTVMSYYGNGLLKSVRDDLGQVTTYTYDDAQRLVSKTLPDSRVINYTYDSESNLTSLTPPNGRLHQMVYGANEKLTSYQPPPFNNNSTFTPTNYTYNEDRQLRRIIRPDGQTILHNYNPTTALLESITGNFGTIAYTYSYDRPTNISYNGANLQLNYSGKTVSGYNLSNGGYPVYSYTRAPHSTVGQRIGTEMISGGNISSASHTINYSYDDDEYVKKVGDLELNYNTPNGQLESTRLKSIRDYYYYNNFGEIRAYKAKYKSTEIYSYQLERDSLGRITKKTEVLNNVTTVYDYTYDSVGRLIQVNKNGAVSSTYIYDSNGNRIGGNIRGEATVALYNSQDRLYQYNDKVYGYTLNGERAYKSLAVNPQPESSLHYYWDPFGNMLRMANEEGSYIDYMIDPALRRSGRMIDGNLKQRYAYNPEGKLIGELDAGSNLIKTFVYGSKSHVPDYYLDKKGNKFKIITDNLGSVRMIVAAGSGRVVKIMEHDEFGRVLQDTRPGFLPFGFAGGLYDKDTGLVRFGARDYDPEIGSWLSKDPIRFDGGDTNLYGYVLNDPVNLIDPNGKSFIEVAIGIAVIAYTGYKLYTKYKESIDKKIKPINDMKGTPDRNPDGSKKDEFERPYDGFEQEQACAN